MAEVTAENVELLKVAVCVPSNGWWTSATAVSVAKLVRHFVSGQGSEGACDVPGEIEIISAKGFMVPEQRSKCVAEAWQMNATHVLWVDSDIVFPEDALLRLLLHNKPVVAVNYPRKSIPPVPTAYVDNAEETGPLYTRAESSGLVEVKHCGFGLMLCEVAVFDALADDLPLFDFEVQPPHKLRWCTEDVYFCRKLRAHGIPVFVDHDLSKEVTHMGMLAFTNGMAESGAELLRERAVRGAAGEAS